ISNRSRRVGYRLQQYSLPFGKKCRGRDHPRAPFSDYLLARAIRSPRSRWPGGPARHSGTKNVLPTREASAWKDTTPNPTPPSPGGKGGRPVSEGIAALNPG